MTASVQTPINSSSGAAAGVTLLVDDNQTFLQTLARALKQRGYPVATATGIDEAVELAESRRVRQAVVDMNLAGVSGLSLVTQLRSLNNDMRIIVLTGYASIATAVEAMRCGATHYLSKPAEMDDLIAAFDETAAEAPAPVPEKPLTVRQLEWEHIQRVLLENDGNISATARALNMHRRTLQRKLSKHTPW